MKSLGKRIICVVAIVILCIMGWFTDRVGEVIVERGGSTVERDAAIATVNGGDGAFVAQRGVKEAKEIVRTVCTLGTTACFLLVLVPFWCLVKDVVKKDENEQKGDGENS